MKEVEEEWRRGGACSEDEGEEGGKSEWMKWWEGRSEKERKRKVDERVSKKKEKEGTPPCVFAFCLLV